MEKEKEDLDEEIEEGSSEVKDNLILDMIKDKLDESWYKGTESDDEDLLGALMVVFLEFPPELTLFLGVALFLGEDELVVAFLGAVLFLGEEVLVTAALLGFELVLGFTFVPELLFLGVGEF